MTVLFVVRLKLTSPPKHNVLVLGCNTYWRILVNHARIKLWKGIRKKVPENPVKSWLPRMKRQFWALQTFRNCRNWLIWWSFRARFKYFSLIYPTNTTLGWCYHRNLINTRIVSIIEAFKILKSKTVSSRKLP